MMHSNFFSERRCLGRKTKENFLRISSTTTTHASRQTTSNQKRNSYHVELLRFLWTNEGEEYKQNNFPSKQKSRGWKCKHKKIFLFSSLAISKHDNCKIKMSSDFTSYPNCNYRSFSSEGEIKVPRLQNVPLTCQPQERNWKNELSINMQAILINFR